MKILLIGEYSNVHNTLAQAFRKLGHDVCVISDGDEWKNYPRDVDIRRYEYSLAGKIKFAYRLINAIYRMRGYDVVQIINPLFIKAKPTINRLIFDYLKKHNKKVFMGAFGLDHYWVKTCLEGKAFRYSDFDVSGRKIDHHINRHNIDEWMGSKKEKLNHYIASGCDGIVACLYEYLIPYKEDYAEKLTYIALPLNMDDVESHPLEGQVDKVRMFIGVQKARSVSKGTDVILKVLEKVCAQNPEHTELIKVESVPYNEYVRLMRSSHILFDQLYSYTPAMNALIAMAQGLVVGSGGEEEMYELLGEKELRPIINLEPDEERLYEAITDIVKRREELPRLSAESIEFVRKHHDHLKVGAQYIRFYSK